VDIECERQPPRRIAFHHLAGDMQRAVRRAHDIAAADSLFDLDRVAEEILPAEFRRGQRLPHLFWRGGDVDGVDRHRFELVEAHAGSFLPSAPRGIASAAPVSSRLFRLERIAGHPEEMPASSLLLVKPSCVSVSFTRSPCGSSTNTTLLACSWRMS